jgi:hypothetical protein
LIEPTFGEKYDLVVEERWRNETAHTWSFKVAPLDEWQQKTVERFTKTGTIEQYHTVTLMQHIVNTGVLAPGNYLVDVFWG